MGRSTRDAGKQGSEFERGADERPPGFFREFWGFARHNRKWWLTPIIITLLLVAVLVVAASTPLGGLIYTVF